MVEEKKEKVEETRAKMGGADTLIEEVRREEAMVKIKPSAKAPNKKAGRRPPIKTSKKRLCKDCKDV